MTNITKVVCCLVGQFFGTVVLDQGVEMRNWKMTFTDNPNHPEGPGIKHLCLEGPEEEGSMSVNLRGDSNLREAQIDLLQGLLETEGPDTVVEMENGEEIVVSELLAYLCLLCGDESIPEEDVYAPRRPRKVLLSETIEFRTGDLPRR